MSIILPHDDQHELNIQLGTSIDELIRQLGDFPGSATLADHYGDVDLLLVFRTQPEPRPRTV